MTESDFLQDLRDGLLLAYIDGALDAETAAKVEAELARNPALAAEAQELADTQAKLAQGLATGLAAQELGEYALGLLPPERAAALERRLARDPDARRRLEELRAYLAAADAVSPFAAPGLVERVGGRVRVLVAELARGFDTPAGAGGFAPVPVGVRGDAGGARTYRVGGGQLTLEIEPSPGDRAKRDLLGLLIGVEYPESLIAQLHLGDTLAAECRLDELGNFTFLAVEPATYHLILTSDALEILASDLQIS